MYIKLQKIESIRELKFLHQSRRKNADNKV